MFRINISLPGQLLEKLREYKKGTGLSISEIIRRAIELYLEAREDKK